MRLQKLFLMAVISLPLCGCAQFNLQWPDWTKATAVDALSLKESAFDQLPGWTKDQAAQAVVPLQRSCAVIMKKEPDAEFGVGGFAGTAGRWQDICRDLNDAIPMTDDEARDFFEAHFSPYEMHGAKGAEGLFTGYYEPVLRGSMKRHKPYLIPIYGRPNDLVAVNLGDFKPALKGETIVGRVSKDKHLVPYYKRAEIEEGALKKQHKEIVWVDNAVDAFFLHIQGSGRIKLEHGETLRVGYAAENGQPYTAIGKALLKRGALQPGNVSMQSIRDWLETHPDEAAEVMNLDSSFIFFRKLKSDNGLLDGPLGAEGVALTPKRSLAVDRKKIPYGVPIFLDAEDPDGGDHIQRLMVAQDTGGAITGAVRGDFFWGADEEATHKAGLMKSTGHAWILLPKAPEAEAAPKQNLIPAWWMHVSERFRKLRQHSDEPGTESHQSRSETEPESD